MEILVLMTGFIACFGFGDAIRCYQCTGINQNCRDGECQGNYCFKNLGEVSDRSVVYKGCQSTGTNACSTGTVTGGARATVCTCNTDLCNDALSNS